MLGVQDALGGSTAIYTWAVCGTGCSPSYLLSSSTLLVLVLKLDTSGSRALLRKSTYAPMSEVSQIVEGALLSLSEQLVLWSLTGKQPSLLTNGQCLLYDASRACQSL
ncbi:hypothetical protein BV20DRAFT_969266 [Pilatotrama ljubarskyi]|nr:hypothetical protein BV20DRAFT_969266 [Pilatotrama ljubarskyi]